MGAIANTIAIVVIVCVGYLIIKKVYPTAVLMIAGLVLLCCAVLLDVEPGLALKKGHGIRILRHLQNHSGCLFNHARRTGLKHYVHGRLRQVHGQA